MARSDEKPGLLKRFHLWLLCYDLEAGLGLLVAAVSVMLLYIMTVAPDDAFTTYQAMMTATAFIIMLVVTAIMFNTARTRASAAELLEEWRESGDAPAASRP